MMLIIWVDFIKSREIWWINSLNKNYINADVYIYNIRFLRNDKFCSQNISSKNYSEFRVECVLLSKNINQRFE